MKQVNFQPEWYRELMLKKSEKVLRDAMLILLAVNMLLAFLWSRNSSNMKAVEDKRQQILSSAATQKNNIPQKDFSTLKVMNYFVSDFRSFYTTNVVLESNKISFQTPVKEAADYYKMIKHIEDKNRYKIINIGKLEQVEAVNLKISLEVVGDQK